MSTDIAQFLWVEGRLSTMERLSLRSFLCNGYEVHLYAYGPVYGLPCGIKVFDAREVLADQYLALAPGVTGNSYAYFSDLFRYELLRQRGGWWFDLDMVCVRHLPCPDDFLVASTWEGKYGQCAVGAAIWSPVGHAAMVEAAACARKSHDAGRTSFGSIGPSLLQRIVKEKMLQKNMAPWWEFCPVPWRLIPNVAQRGIRPYAKNVVRSIKHCAMEVCNPSFRRAVIRGKTRTIHLHNEMWKANQMDKDGKYFPLCLYERLKKQYL